MNFKFQWFYWVLFIFVNCGKKNLKVNNENIQNEILDEGVCKENCTENLCGKGIIDKAEKCDDGVTDNCQYSHDNGLGECILEGCAENFQWDFETSQCINNSNDNNNHNQCAQGFIWDGQSCVESLCGNGQINDQENCDDGLVDNCVLSHDNGIGQCVFNEECSQGYIWNVILEACMLNDCNGNGCNCNPGDTQTCGTNLGVCTLGQQTCIDGEWSDCTGGINPSTEICEGQFDENCDGEVDEECLCLNGETQACGIVIGACAQGSANMS